MESISAIKVKNVGMKFSLNNERSETIKDYVINLLTGKEKRGTDEFWALRDISFSLRKGDRLGILGFNGAGKSTLLKVIAGVYRPTEGGIEREGIIAPLLELGAGFDSQYTARENIYLYGAVLGYSKAFIDEKFEEIIKFSELEQFVDTPVKNYSSGMRSRLGFSICTSVNPDILILDEVLSVGDARFRKKSLKRIEDMFDSNVTVLYVSHSIEQIRRICNKAMILEGGRMVEFGDVDAVTRSYEQMI